MSTYFAKELRADVLVRLSDTDELLRLAHDGDAHAARRAAGFLYERRMLPELRELALPSNDKYLRRRLAFLLSELGHDEELRALAQRSRGAARHHAWTLVEQGRWDEVGPLVVSGDGYVQRAVAAFLRNSDGLDAVGKAVKKSGFNPDGTIHRPPR